MISPFLSRETNTSNIKKLHDIAHTHIKDGIRHITETIESKETFQKEVAKEIVKLSNEGPAKASEIINITAEQLGSISKKNIEMMKESKNPIVQKTAETVENIPVINPETIINIAKETANQVIVNFDKTKNDIEKEIIKEVVKTKAQNSVCVFLKNIYAKIKQFVCNLFKIRNN